MGKKIFTVEFEIEESELEESKWIFHRQYGNEVSDVVAFCDDLQENAYEVGQMHGSFKVLSVRSA